MTRILRRPSYRAMPWKNGGGTTYEVLTEPADSGFDDFQLRLSMAVVATSGPFSAFGGIDRTLTVIDGRVKLAVAGRPPVVLSAVSDPMRFSGDDTASGELSSGPALDFNVMTRRSCGRHAVTRLVANNSSTTYQRQSNWTAIFTVCQRLGVSRPGAESVELELHDLLVLAGGASEPLTIDAHGSGSTLCVEWWPHDQA